MSEIATLRQQVSDLRRALLSEQQTRRQFQEDQAAQIERLTKRVVDLERQTLLERVVA